MRIRKHRAWHNRSKEMLYGPSSSVFQWVEEGQPVEVMDFTGLADKNRVEIYEGDILRYSADGYKFENGDVVFSDGCFKVRCTFLHHLNSTVAPLFEVIGNIFRTPSLLTYLPQHTK